MKNFFTLILLLTILGITSTSNATPTVAASNVTFTNLTTTSFRVNWTSGNGTTAIVVVRPSGNSVAFPANGNTIYTPSTVYGSGYNLGSSNYVVYNGGLNSVTVTGLAIGTSYRVTIFEYEFDAFQFRNEYLTSSYPNVFQYTLDSEPTTSASTLTVTSIAPTTAYVSWASGSGARRIVSVRAASTNFILPVDGTAYSSSSTYGIGTDLGSGAYVVYSSTGSGLTIFGLTPETQYSIAVFEYNGLSGAQNYRTSGYATFSFYTQAAEPTVSASTLAFTQVTNNSITVNWQNGNGVKRIVTAKAASTNTHTPSDFTGYTASSTFGSGSQIGATGAYVVYNGTDNYVTVTGLSAQTMYAFTVYEYNGTSVATYNYLTSSYLTGAQQTQRIEPNFESTAIQFSGISTNSLTVSWTSGTGANRVVAVKPGRKQTAISFDGSNDYVSVPHNSSQNVLPLTVCTWVKTLQGASGWNGIIGKYVLNSWNGYEIYVDNGNVHAGYFANSSNYVWTNSVNNGGKINDGLWHHVAYVVDNSGGKIYVDGVLRSTVSWVGTPTTCTTTQNIMMGFVSGGSYFNGKIDDAQIWNYALTQPQIQANMNKNLNGNESSLIGYWKFDDGYTSSSTAVSSAILYPGMNGTLTNFASTTAATSFANLSGWIHAGSGVNTPVDLSPYTANTIFQNGTQIGNGYYTVYNGSGNSLNITGLSPNTSYNVSVYEYNGTYGNAENYFTNQYATDDFSTSSAAIPTITSFAATSGTLGTLVTINGTNFSSTTTDNIVYFGATQASVSSASPTQLVVIAPAGANYVPISVSVNSMMAYSASPFIVTSSCAGTISYSTPTVLAGDVQSYGNVVGDIDGDGKPEVITANFIASKISVYRNLSTSNIAFATKSDFATNSPPIGLAVADFDGDGKKDIAVTNYTSAGLGYGIISFFRNTSTLGSVSFATRVDIISKSYPWSISPADIDKDGKTDIVVGYPSGDSISIIRNISSMGSIDFAQRKSFIIGTAGTNVYPWKTAVSDLDADGKVDIAVACYGASKIAVLKNTSTTGNISMNTYIDFAMVSGSMGIAIGDLDNDNKPDIVASAGANALRVFKNSTSGTINTSSFSTTTSLSVPVGRSPEELILVDVDGDGTSRTDIVTGYNTSISAVSVFKNNGSMSFSAYSDLSMGSNTTPRFISGGDLNSDGKPDIVTGTANSNVCVLQNTINPLSPEPNSAATNMIFSGVTTGSITVSWNIGAGSNRVVIVKPLSSPVTQPPFDGVNYSANSIYGSGTHLGGGNYVVYNGNGTSVTVTGLQSNTTYAFGVVEYNGSVACQLNYMTSSYLTGTKTTLNMPPTLTAISNPTSVCQNSSMQTVNLSGITSGSGGESQTLVVTALSNNTNLIPNPTVNYTSPLTTGTLSYTPVNGAYGTAVITVTIDDGASNNNTIVRTFTITVDRTPTAASVGGSQLICPGLTNLTGNTATVGTGLWSYIYRSNGAITISNLNNATSTISGFNVNDTARVRWTISNGNCPSTYSELGIRRKNCPLTADFTTTSNTTQCINASPSVTYTDASVSSGTVIVSWSWNFGSGATPATATGQGPHTVTYATSGLKTVSLTVVDGFLASDPEVKSGFVNILPLPSAAGGITGALSTVCQGQTGVLYTVALVSNATSYTWTLPTGANIGIGSGTDSIYVDYGLGALSGNITVKGTNTCGSGTASTAYPVTVSPLPSAAGVITGSTTVCEGVSGITYSVTSIANAVTHIWSVPPGAIITNGSGTNSITVDFTGANSGAVKVYGNNSCGNGDSSEVSITVNPLPDAAGAISGQANIVLCPLPTGVSYSVGFVNNASYYLWTLPSGVTIVSGDSTNSISIDYSLISSSGNVTVKGVNGCGNGSTSTLPINVYTVPNIPICLVTVDTSSTFNRVVWEKPITNDIDSFRIYREITSSFVHIASVPYDSLSAYDDNTHLPAANPNVTSHRYKISVIDTCGNEWNMSAYHKTILLQANIGTSGEVNLTWNLYEGAAVNFYRIYRDSFGTGNFILIDSTAGSNIAYTDLNPPVSNNLGYVLETNWGVSCSPTEATISTTRSNAKGGMATVSNGIKNIFDAKAVEIYPNPTKGIVSIQYPSGAGEFAVEIYNSMGQLVVSDNLRQNSLGNVQTKQLDISNFARGIYTVIISNDQGNKLVKKLILN